MRKILLWRRRSSMMGSLRGCWEHHTSNLPTYPSLMSTGCVTPNWASAAAQGDRHTIIRSRVSFFFTYMKPHSKAGASGWAEVAWKYKELFGPTDATIFYRSCINTCIHTCATWAESCCPYTWTNTNTEPFWDYIIWKFINELTTHKDSHRIIFVDCIWGQNQCLVFQGLSYLKLW